MPSAYLIIFSISGGLSILGSAFLILLYLATAGLGSRAFRRVFWMSLCDLGLSLKFWIALITRADVSMESNKFACLCSAIVGNFFGIATISWYFMISVCVYAVFKPPESRWRLFLEYESIQHVYVWSVSTFTALLPWWTGRYGDMDDGTQCWISGAGDPMKLTLGFPLYTAYLFASYLAVYVFFLSNTDLMRQRIKEKMLVFVGVFLFTWIWPSIALAWDFISHETMPVELHYMDVGAISGSGLFNFLVWIPQVCPCLLERNVSINSTNDERYSAL